VELLLVVLVGCFVGTLAGFFGIGGGAIFVPFLIFFFQGKGVSAQILVQLSLGTSLFITAFASLFSAGKHHQQGNVIWRVVPPLAGFSIVGAFLGSYLAVHLPGEVLKKIFACVLLFFSYQMFRRPKEVLEGSPRYDVRFLFPIGLVTGFISSLVGIGGGIVSIPLMVLILRFPIKKVAGTSSAVIIFTGLAGALSYMIHGWGNPQLPPGTLGFVHLRMALLLSAGSIAFAPWGAKLNQVLEAEKLKLAFSCLLFVVFLKLVFF